MALKFKLPELTIINRESDEPMKFNSREEFRNYLEEIKNDISDIWSDTLMTIEYKNILAEKYKFNKYYHFSQSSLGLSRGLGKNIFALNTVMYELRQHDDILLFQLRFRITGSYYNFGLKFRKLINNFQKYNVIYYYDKPFKFNEKEYCEILKNYKIKYKMGYKEILVLFPINSYIEVIILCLMNVFDGKEINDELIKTAIFDSMTLKKHINLK